MSQSVENIDQLLIAVQVTDSYAKKHMVRKFPLSARYSPADILQRYSKLEYKKRISLLIQQHYSVLYYLQLNSTTVHEALRYVI